MPGPQWPLPGKVTSELRQENGGPTLEGFLKEGALSSEPSDEGHSKLMQKHQRPRGGSEEQARRGSRFGSEDWEPPALEEAALPGPHKR